MAYIAVTKETYLQYHGLLAKLRSESIGKTLNNRIGLIVSVLI